MATRYQATRYQATCDCGWVGKVTSAGFASYGLQRHSCQAQQRRDAIAARVAARVAADGPRRDCTCKVANHQHGTWKSNAAPASTPAKSAATGRPFACPPTTKPPHEYAAAATRERGLGNTTPVRSEDWEHHPCSTSPHPPPAQANDRSPPANITTAQTQPRRHPMTTTTDTAILADTLTPLAADLANIQNRITELQQRETSLKAAIRELVTGPDTYQAGNLTIVVSTNRRFDQARALTLIPDPLRPLVIDTVETVNRDKLKALAPDIYEQAQTAHDYKVSVH